MTSSNSGNPVIIFNDFTRINDDFLFNVLLVVQIHSQKKNQEKQDDFLVQLVPKLRIRKFVIILAFDKATLLDAFLFFDKYKFTRIYGIEKGLSTYAYLPFADNHIQKLSNETPLPNAYKDLNGFKFRTTIQDDIPRVFRYPDKQGKMAVGGCFGQIFTNFLRRHNANYEEVIIKDCDSICFPKILKAINNSDVDFSTNIYTPIHGFDHSYPVKILGLGVMVALNGNLDSNQYFLRPFSLKVWLAIGLIAIYIILMDLVKNPNTKLTVNDIWKSFSQLLLMMLNSSSGTQIKKDYRFYAQVLLMTFILGNIYNNYFTSFLTVFIKMKQFETWQDLIDNNIRVMMADYELKTAQEMNLLPDVPQSVFYPTEYSVYAKERNSMNNSKFAYAIGVDRAEFLIGLQKHFGKPLFHLTRDALSKGYSVYILQKHSPFKEILDTFIIQVLETGLIMKWDLDAIRQSMMAGFEIGHADKDQPSNGPLGVRDLIFAWNILRIGLLLALVVFLGELFLKKCFFLFKK
ncbi:uncharacterized protein LOC129947347 [Eupeodes corollae]|uniref:uncharacterized protein LOC129947347 n=1 Tax=Eupeodes corollae TaxID=290404 RepID=UPI00248F4C1B|nr:uncharacterized protein LOC129947347 [Eupeodes corollae]